MNMREIVNTLPESERVLNCLTEVEHSTQGKTIINNSEARFKDLVNIKQTVNSLVAVRNRIITSHIQVVNNWLASGQAFSGLIEETVNTVLEPTAVLTVIGGLYDEF